MTDQTLNLISRWLEMKGYSHPDHYLNFATENGEVFDGQFTKAGLLHQAKEAGILFVDIFAYRPEGGPGKFVAGRIFASIKVLDTQSVVLPSALSA